MEQRLELWAKVFEASSEGIMIMDGAHHLLSVNRSFCRMVGFGNPVIDTFFIGYF